MKKALITLLAIFIAVQSFAQVKYVFLFIGDGTGANTINFTQQYMAAAKGENGIVPLTMSTFPVCNVATTFSVNSRSTDSAASGSAIATGCKTFNGAVGVKPDTTASYSLGEKAKANGQKVGIITTVGVNDATPASYFGHQPKRSMYDELTFDMLKANFDFYSGDAIYSRHNLIKGDPMDLFIKDGYTLCGCVEDYWNSADTAKKIMFFPDKHHHVGHAIDGNNHTTRISEKEQLECCMDFFLRDKATKRKGFFIMLEGGAIDHFTHGNDAAGAVHEVIAFDEAIAYAYEFYKKHPKETAIIVTSDHDTGAPSILTGYDWAALRYLSYQKQSQSAMTSELKHMMKKSEEPLSWETVKNYLDTNMGLWEHKILNAKDERYLYNVYLKTIAKSETGDVTDDFGYNHNAEIISAAVEVMNKRAGIVWATGSHSGGFVPVFYLGPKPELFTKRFDNSYFFDAISTIAKYK